MLSNYHKEHQSLDQGSHSTEENLLTIQDLRNLFVDDDKVEFDRLQDDASNHEAIQFSSEGTAHDYAQASGEGVNVTQTNINSEDSVLHGNLQTVGIIDTAVNEDAHIENDELIQNSIIEDILDRVNETID